jgi:hypothetical protein
MKRIVYIFLLAFAVQANGSELLLVAKYHSLSIALCAAKIFSEHSNYLNHTFPNVDKLIRTGPAVSTQAVMLGLSMSSTYDLLQGTKPCEKIFHHFYHIENVLFYALVLSVMKYFSDDCDHEDNYNNLNIQKYEDIFKSFAIHTALYALPSILIKKSFHKIIYMYNKKILLYFLYKNFL